MPIIVMNEKFGVLGGGYRDDVCGSGRRSPQSPSSSITVLSDLGSDHYSDYDDPTPPRSPVSPRVSSPRSRSSHSFRNETSGFASSGSTASFTTPDTVYSSANATQNDGNFIRRGSKRLG